MIHDSLYFLTSFVSGAIVLGRLIFVTVAE
jgi:hypothetical protein